MGKGCGLSGARVSPGGHVRILSPHRSRGPSRGQMVLPRHKAPTMCGQGGGRGLSVPQFPHLQNGGKASSWETSGEHQPPGASSSGACMDGSLQESL